MLIGLGCSRYYGPSPNPDTQGLRLDRDEAKIKTILVNRSEQPVFADLEGRQLAFIKDFQQINPGDSLISEDRGFRNIWVTIAWWCEGCQEKVGWSEEELFFSLPGLYTGRPIIITDLMLRDNALQTGVILNVGDPVFYQDDRGNSFALQTGEHYVLTMPAGPITYFTRPIRSNEDSYYHYLRRYNNKIDMRKKHVYFDNQLYDFQILLYEQWRW